MKKITFELPKRQQVEINGQVFDIKKSNRDILTKTAEYQNKSAALLVSGSSADDAVAFVDSVISFIDDILGKGAVSKIMNGAPIDIILAIELMTLVCKASFEGYKEDMAIKYE